MFWNGILLNNQRSFTIYKEGFMMEVSFGSVSLTLFILIVWAASLHGFGVYLTKQRRKTEQTIEAVLRRHIEKGLCKS